MKSLKNFSQDFSHKNILILGIGILGGGIKLVNFLHSLNCRITVSDKKNSQDLAKVINSLRDIPVNFSLGQHKLEDLEGIDFIIRNPAVPLNLPIIKKAKELNIPVLTETALFVKYSQKPVIGVTGTRGKTTTTLLIEHLLNSTNTYKVKSAGNIPGTCSLALLEKENNDYWGTVLELSSWQLQGFQDLQISPHYSILTNIYPDHLNRYDSMKDYILDKEIITKYQTEENIFIYNGANQESIEISKNSKAKTIDFSKTNIEKEQEKFNLLGSHNLENLKAALSIVDALKINRDEIIDSISKFKQVPYRLEKIKTIKNISFINDTTSTTPVALVAALKSIFSPIILIMGGASKNLPIDDLVKTLNIQKNIKKIILIPGSGTDIIKNKIKNKEETQSLKEAINLSLSVSEPGDTVLFSPGFTSFAQYNNEFERGEEFNSIVRSI